MTIGLWAIPTILSILCLCAMFRPYTLSDMYGIGHLFRVFWVIPILFVWVVYLGLVVMFGG